MRFESADVNIIACANAYKRLLEAPVHRRTRKVDRSVATRVDLSKGRAQHPLLANVRCRSSVDGVADSLLEFGRGNVALRGRVPLLLFGILGVAVHGEAAVIGACVHAHQRRKKV